MEDAIGAEPLWGVRALSEDDRFDSCQGHLGLALGWQEAIGSSSCALRAAEDFAKQKLVVLNFCQGQINLCNVKCVMCNAEFSFRLAGSNRFVLLRPSGPRGFR